MKKLNRKLYEQLQEVRDKHPVKDEYGTCINCNKLGALVGRSGICRQCQRVEYSVEDLEEGQPLNFNEE